MTSSTSQEAARLADTLRSESKFLGFDALAITDAGRLAREDFFDRWLRRGFGGKMSYLYRNRNPRIDPRRAWPEVKSVVTLAMNYHTGVEPAAEKSRNGKDGRPIGAVSRYAWGRDYHRVIRKRLIKLARTVEESGLGRAVKCYVDTGPVIEREWAARSGLGWIGKNTLVLNSELGSWFFLGILLLNVELPSDGPQSELCGTCTRCIQACPTGALIQPYVMDSSRCISYLNIELRGWIPRELRARMGSWIFGCDDCQTVCPYNDNPPVSENLDFRHRQRLDAPDLIELLAMDEKSFQDRFQGSPLRRARWIGIVRNAAIALGNSGEGGAMEPLGRALDHAEPIVRGHSAWALGRLGGPTAKKFLKNRLAAESDDEVREEIEAALDDCEKRIRIAERGAVVRISSEDV